MYILPVFIRSHLWLNLNLFVPVDPRVLRLIYFLCCNPSTLSIQLTPSHSRL